MDQIYLYFSTDMIVIHLFIYLHSNYMEHNNYTLIAVINSHRKCDGGQMNTVHHSSSFRFKYYYLFLTCTLRASWYIVLKHILLLF